MTLILSIKVSKDQIRIKTMLAQSGLFFSFSIAFSIPSSSKSTSIFLCSNLRPLSLIKKNSIIRPSIISLYIHSVTHSNHPRSLSPATHARSHSSTPFSPFLFRFVVLNPHFHPFSFPQKPYYSGVAKQVLFEATMGKFTIHPVPLACPSHPPHGIVVAKPQ